MRVAACSERKETYKPRLSGAVGEERGWGGGGGGGWIWGGELSALRKSRKSWTLLYVLVRRTFVGLKYYKK